MNATAALPVPLLAGLLALTGLAVGSFLNVVVWRVPRQESVVSPGSACPGCASPIRPRDNVPVVGWLLLRGRCRHCACAISARYPAVEALTALLFVGVALRFGPDPAVPAYAYLVAVGVALAFIDIDVQRLPDVLTLPSYVIVAGLLAAAAALGSGSGSLTRALLGGAAMWGVYRVLHLVYPPGMGFGDVKLSGVLGMATAWVGWGSWAVGLFGAFLLGGVWGLGLVVRRGAGARSRLPFGPFMLLGAVLGVVAGQPLLEAYLRFTLG